MNEESAATSRSILILVENLPVPFDRRVWMEATTLAKAGWTVTVICPIGRGYEALSETIEGVAILRHVLPPEGPGLVSYIREYSAALRAETRLARTAWRRNRFDVIHLCNPPDLLFLVALPYKVLNGVKVVFDQHDINPELWEAKYGRRGLFYWALRLAERVTYAVADVTIATNDSYREIATTRGRQPSDRVFVVRSGPDLDRFQHSEPNEEYRRGRRFMVGYVGVIGEQEGVDGLLRSIAHIVGVRARDDVQFCVVGDGPAAANLRILARELGIEEYVEFTGRVPDSELISRLSSCDVCVNPDPWTPFNDRSTMNKVLEYMALGKPVVQYDLREGRCSAADASVYVDSGDEPAFGDAILALLDDPARRASMGAVALQRMRGALSWQHQAPLLLQAYARVLRGKGRTV